jgi:hypothetical protein
VPVPPGDDLGTADTEIRLTSLGKSLRKSDQPLRPGDMLVSYFDKFKGWNPDDLDIIVGEHSERMTGSPHSGPASPVDYGAQSQEGSPSSSGIHTWSTPSPAADAARQRAAITDDEPEVKSEGKAKSKPKAKPKEHEIAKPPGWIDGHQA